MNIIRNLVLTSASFLALSTPVSAQDAPADAGLNTGGDGEIIVTARRREESVQDVPLSIQAVTGQQLQKLEIRQFEDITKVVPGLSLSKSGSGTTASLRGIAFNATASGASTSVEFYRNDAVITGTALFQAVYDIGQIEVLRGPQGTLRGRASPSGSITVTTRRPDLSQIGGYASGTVSDAHRWNINGALNLPIIGDKLAVRVAGFVGRNRFNDIYGLNVPLNTVDRDVFDKTRAFRASVRADPLDGVLVLDFNYESIRTSSRYFNQVQSLNTFQATNPATGLPNVASPRTIAPDDRLGVGAIPRTQENNIKIYNWQAVLRQFGQRLTYVGSRQRLNLIANVPGDNAGVFASGFGVTPPNFAPITLFGQYTGSDLTQTTHELRLQNDDRVMGLFDYVVGAFRSSGLTPTTLATQNSPTVTSSPSATLGTAYLLSAFTYAGRGRYSTTQESSLFGNVTMHLGDRTELSGGIRHIWFKANSGLLVGSFGTSTAPSDPYANGVDVASIRRCFGYAAVAGCLPTKETNIYAASLKHNFTEDLMAYASFGTSWRPGNSLVGYQGATVSPLLVNYLNLPDEKSKSFEIGFKSAWLDKRLRFNASAYYQKFNNYPLSSAAINTVLISPTTSLPTLVNTFAFASPVDVTVKGFEAELGFDVSSHFNLMATATFADSKVSGGRVVCVDLNNDNVQDSGVVNPVAYYNQVGADQVDTCSVNGLSASNLPRWSGTVQAEYSQPVGLGNAFLRGFMSWKGDSSGNAVNPNDSVKAYMLVDLFAGVRAENGGWEMSAFVKNLFNTQRVLTRDASPLSTNSSLGALSYNYVEISMTDPREVGVSLRYAFGSR
ncbi:MAG: TonB-dependent receptor [Novosphingobium sp.]|nr:TonB-dependent receptor [Novosphingobium sp.]